MTKPEAELLLPHLSWATLDQLARNRGEGIDAYLTTSFDYSIVAGNALLEGGDECPSTTIIAMKNLAPVQEVPLLRPHPIEGRSNPIVEMDVANPFVGDDHIIPFPDNTYESFSCIATALGVNDDELFTWGLTIKAQVDVFLDQQLEVFVSDGTDNVLLAMPSQNI